MPKGRKQLRVLIVDDNRDGADILGLLVEELGHHAHVTYGGKQALDVAAAFRPDLMLVDLVMPGMDGFDLVSRLRQNPDFQRTQLVAVTGMKDDEYKTQALMAGCDAVLVKPVALNDIKIVLAGVVPLTPAAGEFPAVTQNRERQGTEQHLPIDAARRIRNQRESKALTESECQAVIRDGIVQFQAEFLGRSSERVQVHFLKELVLVRIRGALTPAEYQLAKSVTPEKGRNLIKESRIQLLELARPMLESLIYEVTGVKVVSMHQDISTITGEEVILFSLAKEPRLDFHLS